MNNDTGSTNPWFSAKGKTQEELQVPEHKPRSTENDMLSTRKLSGPPSENDGKTRWFGVRQSYTNLPAHKLINELQQGRYDPYAAIDGIRLQSLDHMNIQARGPMPEPSIMPSTNLADRNKIPVYTPPITQDISTDWTVNYATPMLPPLPDEVSLNPLNPINPQSTESENPELEYKFQPEINPMQFVEQYGNELPSDSIEEICCDDFSPIENIMKARQNNENVFQFNSANRLPAFKKPPRSLT